MVYSEIVMIDKLDLEFINNMLENEENNEGVVFTRKATFTNGMTMEISCVGTDSYAYTEAILINKNGQGVNYTECAYEYDGMWGIEYNGDMYEVDVVAF